jgi:tRNA pseudouridine55 synthase
MNKDKGPIQSKTAEIYEEGKVLLINKPLRWTSFDAVRKISNAIKIKKVGKPGRSILLPRVCS